MVKFGRSCNQAKILAVGELTYSVLCRKCAMIWLPIVPVSICMLTSCVQFIQDRRVRHEQEFVRDMNPRETSKRGRKGLYMHACLFCQLYMATYF